MNSLIQETDAQRLRAAAERRVSVRRFGKPPSDKHKQALTFLSESLSGQGVRIVFWPDAAAVFGKSVKTLGLSGATSGAAFIADASVSPRFVGYVCERFILDCAAMGLGTCWMVSTYNHGVAKSMLTLSKEETLSAVSPIGLSFEGPLTPISDSKRKRKDIAALTGLTDIQFSDLSAWQRDAILCARSAPSAMNRQPWRFIPGKADITLVSKKSSLDTGIAMFHLELGAAAAGAATVWEQRENDWILRLETP